MKLTFPVPPCCGFCRVVLSPIILTILVAPFPCSGSVKGRHRATTFIPIFSDDYKTKQNILIVDCSLPLYGDSLVKGGRGVDLPEILNKSIGLIPVLLKKINGDKFKKVVYQEFFFTKFPTENINDSNNSIVYELNVNSVKMMYLATQFLLGV